MSFWYTEVKSSNRALPHPALLDPDVGTTEISGDDAIGRHRTKKDGRWAMDKREGKTKRSEGLKKQRLTLHSQPWGLEGVHTCVWRVKYLSKTRSQRNTVNQ